jgi:putative membrane protein
VVSGIRECGSAISIPQSPIRYPQSSGLLFLAGGFQDTLFGQCRQQWIWATRFFLVAESDFAMDFPGWNGFLGTRASLMLDVVCLAMVLVVLVLGWSIRLVRCQRRYELHKRIQLTLAVMLVIVLSAFETDVRLHGWQERAAGEIGGEASTAVITALSIHLFFAVTTVVLWVVVLARAWRRFPNPAAPNEHSKFHRRWARLAAWDLVLTTVTGWVFYFMAFVR